MKDELSPFQLLQKAISHPDLTHLLLLDIEKDFQSQLSLEHSREYFQYLFGETKLSEHLTNIRCNYFIMRIDNYVNSKNNEQTIQKSLHGNTTEHRDLFS